MGRGFFTSIYWEFMSLILVLSLWRKWELGWYLISWPLLREVLRHQEVSEPPPNSAGRRLCSPSQHVSSIGQKHRCVGEVCASHVRASSHDFRAMWSAALIADQERSDPDRRGDRPGGETPTHASPARWQCVEQSRMFTSEVNDAFCSQKNPNKTKQGKIRQCQEFFTLLSGYSSSIVSAVILLCCAEFSSGRLPLPLWPKHSSSALGLCFLWDWRQCPFR